MPSLEKEPNPKILLDEQPECQLESDLELNQGEAGFVDSRVFDPESLERMCRHDLSGALRPLANHLDRKEISASLWNFQGREVMPFG